MVFNSIPVSQTEGGSACRAKDLVGSALGTDICRRKGRKQDWSERKVGIWYSRNKGLSQPWGELRSWGGSSWVQSSWAEASLLEVSHRELWWRHQAFVPPEHPVTGCRLPYEEGLAQGVATPSQRQQWSGFSAGSTPLLLLLPRSFLSLPVEPKPRPKGQNFFIKMTQWLTIH